MCTHTTKIQGQTVFLVLLTAPVPFACIQFAFLELHTGSENERQNKGRGERVQPAHFSVFFFLGGNAALEFSARFTLLASRASAPHHAQPTPPPAKFCSYCCFSALIVLRWCAAQQMLAVQMRQRPRLTGVMCFCANMFVLIGVRVVSMRMSVGVASIDI